MIVKELKVLLTEFLKDYLKDHNLTAEKPISCHSFSLVRYIQCSTTVDLGKKAPDTFTEKMFYYKSVPVHLLVYLYGTKARFTARIDLDEVEIHESHNVQNR